MRMPASTLRAELVEPVEDDALPQGPRADLELRQVEDVHHRGRDERPGHDLVGPAGGDARQLGDALAVHLEQLGDPLLEVGGGEQPAYEQALAGWRRPADAGERAERLRRRDRV